MPDEQIDDFELGKHSVTKLSRQKLRSSQLITQQNTNINNPIDTEHEDEQQNKANQSCFKKFVNSIYIWDNDFRFTTMVICTYTVAIVFLYYLACTFAFLYISRTTGHITFLKSYIESSTNIGQ